MDQKKLIFSVICFSNKYSKRLNGAYLLVFHSYALQRSIYQDVSFLIKTADFVSQYLIVQSQQ